MTGKGEEPRRPRLIEHNAEWDREGYPNALVEALDRYPLAALTVAAITLLILLGGFLVATGAPVSAYVIPIVAAPVLGLLSYLLGHAIRDR